MRYFRLLLTILLLGSVCETYCQSQPVSTKVDSDKYPYAAVLGGDNVWILKKEQVVSLLRRYYAIDTTMAISILELTKAQALIDSLYKNNEMLKTEIEDKNKVSAEKDKAFVESIDASNKLYEVTHKMYIDCTSAYGALKKKNFFDKIGDFPNWGPIKLKNIIPFGLGLYVGIKIQKSL